MKVIDLFKGTHVKMDGKPDNDVTGITCDSRKVTKGSLFAALHGHTVDGHRFIPDALKSGARAILAQTPRAKRTSEDVTWVRAVSSRRAFAQAARNFFGDPSALMTLVGVTGTNGKTTTVNLLYEVFRAAGRMGGVIGTLGVRTANATVATGLTTPESSALASTLHDMADAGVNAVAMEVSSHALDQERVSCVEFDAGIFLNLTQDHLDYHSSVDDYFAAKARLIRERLKPGGMAVVNVDDPFGRALVGESTVTFSARGESSADISLVRSATKDRRTTMVFARPSGEIRIETGLLGDFNRENIAAVVATAYALGLADDAVMRALGETHGVPGRFESVSKADEPLVIVDYAHTPDALEKVLVAARELGHGQLACVFGCGGDRDPHKRAPMGDAVGRLSDRAIVTNDNPRTEDPQSITAAIESGLKAHLPRAVNSEARGYQVILDRARAIEEAILAAGAQDVVVIAGKGHEDYQIVGETKLPFDDREVARACLAKRRGKQDG